MSTPPPSGLNRDASYGASPRAPSPPRGTSTIHDLCRYGPEETARAVIKSNPSIVNELDQDDNTPLHAACASTKPSVPLIRDLMLAGASASLLNRAGFAPLHVAALNLHDTDNSMKRYLIFKAGINPNQRTAKGENVGHLCASNDQFFDNLKFFATVGVDFDVTALASAGAMSTSGVDDRGGRFGVATSPNRVRPIDVSRMAGAAATKSLAFLGSLTMDPVK